MRIAFAGTPEFAADALRALHTAGHEIAIALTQPDRPAGRGMKLMPSPVKQSANDYGIPVYQPVSLKTAESLAPLQGANIEAMVVVAYGLILPPAVLSLPTLGCLNIHASLLPRWRGAAPIQRAILAGDAETGVCIMQMDAGLDTGPVLLRRAIPIAATDTADTLHDKLKVLGAALIVETLAALPTQNITALSQPATGVTYAEKLKKEEAEIDWSKSAIEIERKIRAFNPFPIAQTHWNGTPLRIWRAEVVMNESGFQSPGCVMHSDADGIVVACGEGALRISELQKAGGKRLNAEAFLAGNKIVRAAMLGQNGT